MACGASSAPAAAPSTASVTAAENFRFLPQRLTVRRGDARITLTNDSSYPHNIAVPALRRTSRTVSGSLGAKTTTLVLRDVRPGTYRFICTYHDQAGMAGVLVVR